MGNEVSPAPYPRPDINEQLRDAASGGRREEVQRLLSAGAEVNGKNSDGRTALYCAADNGHVPCLELLLSAGAKVNAKDRWGNTALHHAANNGHVPCLEPLLSAGVDVHAKDCLGGTALHDAAEHGHVPCLRVLHSHGALLDAKDKYGNTPLGSAIRRGKTEAAAVLRELMQQQPQRAAEKRAAEQRAAEKRAAEQRAAEKRAAEKRAAEKRAAEQRAAEQRAAEQRAAEKRAAEKRAAEKRAAEQRAAEQRAAEKRAAEQRAAEQRAAEKRAAEQRAAEKRAAEQKAAEKRAAEQRAAEQRAAEKRAAEQRAAEQRAAEQRAAEQRKLEEAIARAEAAEAANAALEQKMQKERQKSEAANRAAEQRAAEKRAAEQRAAEQRAAVQRAAEQRAAKQGAAEAAPVHHPAFPHRGRKGKDLIAQFILDPSLVDFLSDKTVGVGAQADVYMATWANRTVALKMPRVSNQAALDMIYREARALARVQHPNVVKLIGVVEPSGDRLSGVVMPWAEGGTLAYWLLEKHREPITRPGLGEVLKILLGIASGMMAVHEHGILHLDLKPENVLLTEDGTPWVADFGLAASLTSMSASAVKRGTTRYKSPERLRTRKQGGAVLSKAADVYGFAVLAWEVLTGVHAWEGHDDSEIISNVLFDGERPELPDGRRWQDEVAEEFGSPELVSLIEVAWAQDHELRPDFQTIWGQLLDVLTTKTNAAAALEERSKDLQVRLAVEEAKRRELQEAVSAEAASADAGGQAEEGRTMTSQLQGEIEGVAKNQGVLLRELAVIGADGGANAAVLQRQLEQQAQQLQQVQQVLQVLLANQSSHASQTAAIQATLATQGAEQQVTQQLLATLAQGETDCPRLIWLRPVPKSTKLLSRLKRSMKPSSWLVDKYDVFFVCPVTLKLAVTGKGGNGYRVEMPQQWVQDYGPAIRASLAFLKTAVVAGRLMGLPLPTVPTLDDLAPGADCLCALTEFMGDLDHFALGELDKGNSVSQTPAVGASYRKLKSFMEELDPGLLNCGLKKVVCRVDGSVEWVGPGEATKQFQQKGKAALCWDTAL